jgi:hypothetical protein
MKYIQNVHTALIKCKVVDAGAPLEGGRPVPREFFFRPATTDRGTGRALESGYTPIEDSDYDLLMAQSKTFSHFTDPAKHMLYVHDDLPDDIKTPQDVLVSVRKDLQAANTLIATLQAQVATNSGKALTDAKAEITNLKSQITALQDQLNAAKAAIPGAGKVADSQDGAGVTPKF